MIHPNFRVCISGVGNFGCATLGEAEAMYRRNVGRGVRVSVQEHCGGGFYWSVQVAR